MHVRRKLLVIAAGLACVLPSTAASATTATECAGTWTWSFNPPLGLVHTYGTGTVTVTSTFPHNTCVSVSDSCPGQLACAGQQVGWSGQFTAPWAGNCVSATVFPPGSAPAVILGGAVVQTGTVGSQVYYLTGAFANACAVNPATGAFVWGRV